MVRKRLFGGLVLLLVSGVGAGAVAYFYFLSDSNDYIGRWLREPEIRPEWIIQADEPCAGAPFLLPSSGFIGLLWGDTARPYNPIRRHTGIDIFGDGEAGTVPVVAAYDGYLTRMDNWLASVIIRHEDPFQQGRTIWTYYTHLAHVDGTSLIDDAFPPGTEDMFVSQGTLLGYQGDYNGTGVRIATHLHFTIVTSDDDGSFRNEAVLGNTLDPSPYLGMPVRFLDRPEFPIRCES